jgi:hypothetical protein
MVSPAESQIKIRDLLQLPAIRKCDRRKFQLYERRNCVVDPQLGVSKRIGGLAVKGCQFFLVAVATKKNGRGNK